MKRSKTVLAQSRLKREFVTSSKLEQILTKDRSFSESHLGPTNKQTQPSPLSTLHYLFFLLLLHRKYGIHTAMVSPAASTNSEDSDVTAQSEDCARKEFLMEFTKAVKVAFQSYTHQDSAARDRGENFDGPVYVDCDSQISPWFTAEELGLVCQSARRGARVDAFQASGKVVVRECASGFRHSFASAYVGYMVSVATSDYSNKVCLGQM
jgi:hypothetical protein